MDRDDTTIPVTKETYRELYQQKRYNETWEDCIRRLALDEREVTA